VPVLQDVAATPTDVRGAFEVELPGVFHRSALLPMWRDLQYRLGDRTLVAIDAHHLDHVDDLIAANESWYRLSLRSFPTKLAAAEFCARLAKSGQACKDASLLTFNGIITQSLP
jgi:hypothetical protein